MSLWHGVVVFAAAFIAGMMNSVAGGGTLVTFPTLIWLGMDPIQANVSSTVSLWPGSLGAMYGFRRELAGSRRWMRLLGDWQNGLFQRKFWSGIQEGPCVKSWEPSPGVHSQRRLALGARFRTRMNRQALSANA